MNPQLRSFLSASAAAVLAAWMGWEIAQGDYIWPALFGVFCIAAIVVRMSGQRADVVLVGMIIAGYLVGNRGFAQLMPAPSVPLLPAETGLLLAGGWLVVGSALQRRFPFRPDALNWAVLAWVVAGTVRVAFDVRTYGMLAVRDYATVYYAGFFFIVQDLARQDAARGFIYRVFRGAIVVLLPMFGLYLAAQDFFLSHLVIRGMPVIYYKGDLVFTFLMAGSPWLFYWGIAGQRRWATWVAMVLFLAVAASESRASLAGGLVAFALLAARRRWRYVALQAGAVITAALAVSLLAQLTELDWAEQKMHSATDRLRSMVDVSGRATYRREEGTSKGDNNRFRLVWWENVVRQTMADNPVFGVGFGADITTGFLREYYPDLTDEFTTRSPHNILVTIFGRMGVVGLAFWGVLCAALLRVTLRILARDDARETWGLAVAPWVVIISSCFGVVLEGPMAAVPFWTMLGLLAVELRKLEEPAAAKGTATDAVAAPEKQLIPA